MSIRNKAIAGVALLVATVWGQAPQKNWKDHAEYDLYDAITKAQDATKRLELLNKWKQSYPTTDYHTDRLLLFLSAYHGLNQVPQIYQTAKELNAADSKDMTALYWLTVLAPAQPNGMDVGATAAQGLLANLDTAFAADKKPAQMPEAAWTRARTDMESLAHKTLGWVAMTRKDQPAAEKHLRESLKLNPASGEAASWLGLVLYSQRKVPEGLFYMARAATYTGPGALPEAARKDTDTRLMRAYTGYHGDATGLAEVKKLAETAAAPPAGFAIKSVTEVQAEADAARLVAEKSDPQGALWKRIKGELTGADGESYFESSLKGAKPAEKSFRGKVVSSSPKELVLAMSDESTGEATLRVEGTLPNVETGTILQFTGVVQSYSKEPFMVVFDAERSDISGLPAGATRSRRAAGSPRQSKERD